MMSDAFAKALSAREIGLRAVAWRDVFNVSDQWVPDMVDILEVRLPVIFPEYALAVRDDCLMEDAEAYTQFDPARIVLRESVYRGALDHEARSRMTLAHELGHLVLHKGVAKARSPVNAEAVMRPFNSAEWQARKFAALFLMPAQIVRQFPSAVELANGCRVSLQAASIRFDEVGHIKPKAIPDVVQDFLDGKG